MERPTLTFNGFEIDPEAWSLRNAIGPVKLQANPVRVLYLLASRAGRVVPRADIKQELWGDDVFVDFDQNINFCIRQIRTALGDDAENPAYVETIPRIGYRFLARVEAKQSGGGVVAPSTAEPPSEEPTIAAEFPRRWLLIVPIATILLAVIAFAAAFFLSRTQPQNNAEHIRLVVLPIVDHSGDPAQVAVNGGITDDLISRLSAVSPKHLHVIARTTSVSLKERGDDARSIGEKLGVDYLLEGSTARKEGKLQLQLQLVEPHQQEVRWTATYDASPQNLLNTERQITSEVSRALHLTAPPVASAASTQNTEAHQAYLQGLYYLNLRRAEDAEKACGYLRKATELDPQYALAHAMLGRCYVLTAVLTDRDIDEPKARASIQRALQLDPSSASGHLALADLLFRYDWDWAAAESEYQTSLRLDPSNIDADLGYARFLTAMNRPAEAITYIEAAQSLDPINYRVPVNYIYVDYVTGRHAEGIAAAQRALELRPNQALPYFFMSWFYQQRNELPKAIEARVLELRAGGRGADAERFAATAAKSGFFAADRELAAKELQSEQALGRCPTAVVGLYLRMNDLDGAMAALQRAQKERCPFMADLKSDPRLVDLRNRPAFQQMMREMKLQ